MKNYTINKNIFFVAGILVIIGVLVYLKSFTVPFYFDDINNIVENNHLYLKTFSVQSIKDAAFLGPSANRPVAKITFGLNYYFNQHNVFGYHFVNILIHITTSFLLYIFVIKTIRLCPDKIDKNTAWQIAFFTALVWLIHPVQTNSVTYIVQRMTSLAALFYLSSFISYIKGRTAKNKTKIMSWFSASAVFFLLAAGSKENAAILPVMILLYEYYFFQDLSYHWLKKKLPYVLAALTLVTLFSFIYMNTNPVKTILSGYDHRNFTLWERLLTQPRVIFHYLSLLVLPLPSRLTLDYDYALSHGLFDPFSTFISICGILFLTGTALYLARKQRLISFCILWFLVNLVIESSIVPLEIAYEHRLYLPSMLFFLVLFLLFYKLTRRPILMKGAAYTLVILFSFWTIERNNTWAQPLPFWQDCVAKSPNKARPHNNYGLALLNAGKINEAIIQYKTALQLDPSYIQALGNLGSAYMAQGNKYAAIDHYEEYLKHDKNHEKALNNTGILYAQLGRFNKAKFYFSRAIEVNPLHADAHNNMGNIELQKGNYTEAIAHYNKTLKIDPEHKNAKMNLALAMRKSKTSNTNFH
jgi:tetratricopeptide (TPR) repeat protein